MEKVTKNRRGGWPGLGIGHLSALSRVIRVGLIQKEGGEQRSQVDVWWKTFSAKERASAAGANVLRTRKRPERSGRMWEKWRPRWRQWELGAFMDRLGGWLGAWIPLVPGSSHIFGSASGARPLWEATATPTRLASRILALDLAQEEREQVFSN